MREKAGDGESGGCRIARKKSARRRVVLSCIACTISRERECAVRRVRARWLDGLDATSCRISVRAKKAAEMRAEHTIAGETPTVLYDLAQCLSHTFAVQIRCADVLVGSSSESVDRASERGDRPSRAPVKGELNRPGLQVTSDRSVN